jgi:hypothetical protein
MYARVVAVAVFVAVVAVMLAPGSPVHAQAGPPVLRLIRHIEADDYGAPGLPGLPFPPGTGVRFVFSGSEVGGASITVPNLVDPESPRQFRFAVSDSINFAFDASSGSAYRLMLVQGSHDIAITDVEPTGRRAGLVNIGDHGIEVPAGMTFDPTTGTVFILDDVGGKVVSIDGMRLGDTRRRAKLAAEIALPRGLAGLRGIAVDPADGHLHVLGPTALYELDGAGRFLAVRSLPEDAPRNLRAMAFGPSTDRTDDPAQTSLFLVGTLGEVATVTEWSLTAPSSVRGAKSSQPATLVKRYRRAKVAMPDAAGLTREVDASAFDPPSPDPAGIAYDIASDSLLISDSEVNEMPIYGGSNVFRMTRSGDLFATSDTTAFSDEPTGVAINPANGHCFFSDDAGRKRIYEVDPGPDNVCLTNDDGVTSFSTRDFGSGDPEGLAFGDGKLFVIDGINKELYTVSPGANGIFGTSDDEISSCDVASHGLDDPEGIVYEESSRSIYLVGNPEDVALQMTPWCSLMRSIDISAANAVRPAGATMAPSSVDPGDVTLWIADRGEDNDPYPDENDGMIYELSLPPLTPGNAPPVALAGPDQALLFPEAALLEGIVSDDGIPSPSSLSSSWAQRTGPGVVVFGDSSLPVTRANFPLPGTYELRLTSDDGELRATDEVEVHVFPSDGSTVLEVRVEDGADDAEEGEQGVVDRKSGDLELVYDHEAQIVGTRFNSVEIPRGANILAASVQFQADEIGSPATHLSIQGEAADSAAPFLEVIGDISSRSRTAAEVPWSPAPWLVLGEAGADQRTPDVRSIVQEIVDRPGWSSGNALAFLFTGTGGRVAEAFDSNPNAAPLLWVRYALTIDHAPTVKITAPSSDNYFRQRDQITFTGSATDSEDGDLSNSLVWTSGRDGVIGTGADVTVTGLTIGRHYITASVTDSAGNTQSDRIRIRITR